jgi:hypothetical protein
MAAKQRKSASDATDNASQRLNIRVSAEAYRRLGVHAVMSGMTPGRLVENLINAHCREFRVQVIRGAQATSDDRLDVSAGVSTINIPANL